jgi:preprotein translocase subunit SecE
MTKLATYLRGSYEEMKKVTWPTKKEARNFTLLVVGISLSVAAFLGLMDFLFSKILEVIV